MLTPASASKRVSRARLTGTVRELCGEHGALFVHEGGFGKHPSSRGGIVDDQTDGPLVMAVSGEGFDVDPRRGGPRSALRVGPDDSPSGPRTRSWDDSTPVARLRAHRSGPVARPALCVPGRRAR